MQFINLYCSSGSPHLIYLILSKNLFLILGYSTTQYMRASESYVNFIINNNKKI